MLKTFDIKDVKNAYLSKHFVAVWLFYLPYSFFFSFNNEWFLLIYAPMVALTTI